MVDKTNFAMNIFCFWMFFHAAQAQEKTNPLIICYLGSLATRTVDNVHSMNGLSVNSELFNVDNAVNNSLAKYCAEEKNISWHGIKVRTEKSNGKSIIKLSTSFLGLGDEESFEIDAQRQFVIHFGNENEFSAYVTVDGGESFEIVGDKAKLEAFTELALKGAHLKDFVGFWTLGLDMLPWVDHEVELYGNRTCSCTMEAWFLWDFRIPNLQQGTHVTFRVKLHSIEDDFRIFFFAQPNPVVQSGRFEYG
ncbi:hypothetical protein GPALN_006031 [Globodera pallida]|nr:hypothetical protein GPALN_006031 [Globodera pallida]